MRDKITSYYRLTKPGIVYGNLMHVFACAVFALAVSGGSWWSVMWVMIGLAFIVASACVINCIIDREIDKKMDRTKKRPLAVNGVSVTGAMIYAGILLLAGMAVLYLYTNIVTLMAGLIGHITYTAVYGYVKRQSWISTMVGTIPGAMPALAGYAAIDPTLPPTAWLLWIVVLLWQLPHFYALSLYRRSDYQKSGLPLMSVVKPRSMVTRHMVVSAVLYGLSTIALIYYSTIPLIPTFVLSLASLAWIYVIMFAKNKGTNGWARKVFGTSLYLPMIMVACSLLALL